MNELVLQIKNLRKTFDGRDILKVKQLSVYQGSRIAIIGTNGSGKSTLLKLIAQEIFPDEGRIKSHVDFSYFTQIEKLTKKNVSSNLDGEWLSRFNVPSKVLLEMSGGEQNKARLIQVLSQYQEGMLLDEPTTHLDEESIQQLSDELEYYFGTLIFVSHDRHFINRVATKIWEIEDGRVTEYDGDYESYRRQKEQIERTQKNRFNEYRRDKQKLEKTIENKEKQVIKLKKVSTKQHQKNIKPSRLSASKSKDSVQKAAEKAKKVVEHRLQQLEKIETVQKTRKVYFPIPQQLQIHSQYPIRGDEISLIVDGKELIQQSNFEFKMGSKIALIGANGSGKTCLLNYILKNEKGIYLSPKVVFSTFEQLSYQFDEEEDILSYVMKQSDFDEVNVRSVLHRLGFTQTSLMTKMKLISGGEATRIALALAFLRPANILVLDEPTNFIDLKTIEALEELIKAYQGMVIFVSHDQSFIKACADEVFRIEKQRLIHERP